MPHQRALVANLVSALLGLACVSLVTAVTPANAAPARKETARSDASAPGRPMTASELRQLYGGKTWIWANGGGYMDPSGKFVGVAGKDYTRGTWRASSNGRMCFGGVWTGSSKPARGQACFAHRVMGDTVYQRKDPSGSWYVFKNSPVGNSDEFSKLVEGDRISDQLKQVQASLTSR